MTGLVFFFVKNPEVLLASVEVKTTNWFAVVVVKQDCAVALGIAHHDSFWAYEATENGTHRVEALNLLRRRDDLWFRGVFYGYHGDIGFCCWC